MSGPMPLLPTLQGMPDTLAHRPWRRVLRTYAIVALFAVALAAAAATYTVNTRRAALTSEADALGRFGLVLAEHVNRTLFGADLLAVSLQDEIEHLGITDADALYARLGTAAMHAHLQNLVFNTTDIDSLNFADRRGRVITSVQWPATAINVAERDFFKALRGGERRIVSPPHKSRLTGQEVIMVGRRIESPQGEFLGIAYTAVSTHRFRKAFADATRDGADPTAMMLFQRDGRLISAYPDTPLMRERAAAVWQQNRLALRRQDVLDTRFEDDASTGTPGHGWLLALRNGQAQPFVLALAIPESHALAAWSEAIRLIQVFAAIAILLSVLVARGFLRVGAARAAAADLADRLAQANADLATVNRRLHEVKHHARLGHWQFDVATGTGTLSGQSCRILEVADGTPLEEAALRRHVHPDDRDALRRFVAAALRPDRVPESNVERDFRLRMPDGRIKYVVARSWIEADASGRPAIIAGSIQDVSAIRAAEDGLRRARAAEESARLLLQRVLDSIPVRVFWKDRNLDYLGCNRLFAQDAGLNEPSQLVGRNDLAMAWREQAELYRADDRHVIDSGEARVNYEEPQTTPDGRRIWLRTSKVPLRDGDGRVFGVLGTYEDITERKKIEEDLRAAQQAAEAASRAKSFFLANVSHEIRTPLNAVLGFAQIGARKNVHPEATRDFGRILAAGHRLLGLINDVLDFSKIEAGKLAVEHQPMRLDTAVCDAVALIQPDAEAKGLKVETSIPPLDVYVRGDAMRVGQVLVNLLSNAVKFTERGSVRLAVRRDRVMTYFDVIDTGIGISDEQKRRLFAPFEQGDGSTTRRYGGTGLGLAISRDLAHLMGGDISVTSRVGAGSTFTLSIPLPSLAPLAPTDEPAAPQPDHARNGRRLDGLRVLAAEDVDLNRAVLEDLLVAEGAHVVFAVNGQQAIEHVQERGGGAFDIVLMDVQMPVLGGIEAAERIRKLAPLLPIIGLTAHAMEEEHARCRAAGMVAHVTKPFDFDQLIGTMLAQTRPPAGAGVKPAQVEPAAAAAPVESDSTAEGVDWVALGTRFAHRTAYIEKLLRMTVEHYAGTPSELRTAATRRDLPLIADLAHRIKSGIGSIEARGLFAFAGYVEQRARLEAAQAPDEITLLARELADRLDVLLAQLRQRVLDAGATEKVEAAG